MAEKETKLPKGFIDLGEKIKNPVEIKALDDEADSLTHYPSLWFHNQSELKSLPKEGTAMIKYKKIMEREETITVDGEKEERYTTELQIFGIMPHEGSEGDEGGDYLKETAEDAIDKGLEAAGKPND